MTAPDTRLMNADEVAAELGLCADTVKSRAREGLWPRTKIGRSVRWTRAQVNQIIAMHAVEPIEQTPRRRKAS